MDAWEDSKHVMIVEDTLHTCTEYLTVSQRDESAEHQAQTLHILVLGGKLRMAVRWITERETGGFLQPMGDAHFPATP